MKSRAIWISPWGLVASLLLTATSGAAQENPEAFRRLTRLGGVYYPTWAPDGRTLAFSGANGRILAVSLDGGPPWQITGPEGPGGGGTHPSWSPDGEYIAHYAGVGSGNLHLRVVSIHGGPPIRVVPSTVPISRSGNAAWSPDGLRIAFSSLGKLWTVELTSGELTLIHDPGEPWARPFGWSPDGRHISADVGVPGSGESDVWVLAVDGSTAKRLTDFPGREGNPVWSPDGSRIAFMAERGGNRDLWVMPAEGGEAVRVTFHPGMEGNPRWSPDGRMLAFMSERDNGPDIWLLDLERQLGPAFGDSGGTGAEVAGVVPMSVLREE